MKKGQHSYWLFFFLDNPYFEKGCRTGKIINEAPMQTEWANIYTWLGLQYAIQIKSKDQLEAMIEIAPKELSDYEKRLLKDLRIWIYDKRRKALKDILKKNKISKEDIILDIQEKLF